MNWQFLVRKLSGRATCVLGRSARLGSHARIINMGARDSCIQVGEHSIIEGELLVFRHGGQIRIGRWCYIGEGSRIWSGSSITIGDRVLIAHSVNVFDNLTHPIDRHARHQHFRHIAERGHPPDVELDDKPVIVGNDAWIGAGAAVMRGVSLGEGAIVAAGAVVTSDVAAMTIVAGNPARFVRSIEPGAEIASQQIADLSS